MPTYITLAKWTDQGVRTVKDTVSRLEQARGLAEQHGGRLIDVWWTQGAYDVVGVFEMPDDETYSAFALSIAMGGNIRSESMRAFKAEEMQRIIQKLP